jgi:hypothetical protein
MATQTITEASFANGLVRYEVVYDDVSLLVTALRCINDSDQGPDPAPSSGRVWLVNDPSRAFPPGSGTDPSKARITPAGVTESVSVPTNQASRLQLVVTLRRGSPTVSNLDGEFIGEVE